MRPLPKPARYLARRPPTRKSKDRVLIVCEGSKTEPNYLEELKEELGLSSTDVRVCGQECGSDPKDIVKYALRQFSIDSDIDSVFCVFDRDGHTTFDAACAHVDQKRKKFPKGKRLQVIRSVPCFEYWILLHFEYSTAPIVSSRGKTAGECALSKVRMHLATYNKGATGLYQQLADKIERAMINAARAVNEAQKNGTDNPITEMHMLISYLRSIAA